MSSMPDELSDIASGLKDVPWDVLDKSLKRGEKQAESRDMVIDALNRLGNALQLAADLVSAETSKIIMEYAEVRTSNIESLQSFFARSATRLDEPSLRVLLHEGKVCGELHRIADRLRQPFTWLSASSLSLTDWLRTLGARTNTMAIAIGGLTEGERHYLFGIARHLERARLRAESARTAPVNTSDIEGSRTQLVAAGDEFIAQLQDGRARINSRVIDICSAARHAAKLLH